ncbi:hypothetical protein [Paraferrimonas haliotis]|uniref:Hemolysin activation/secretion protein n=1 Tax=Paraferrimonas haliotis TaxID=2013866 RepID=A0AA37WX27_9GAMM|nr:hypothetical protein [Paraferrimonas haliotis]GLS82040.1 hypothetical protein GCM10007894_00170 [Paraferrimonas haliotis]
MARRQALNATVFIVLVGLVSLPVAANNIEDCHHLRNMELLQNDIFDPQDPEFMWIHKVANALHIVTKEVTVRDAVDGFELCGSDRDLAEIERYLRGRSYLKDAKVEEHTTAEGEPSIRIETWDNWSLLPTVNFGRSGGETKFSVGLKDSNFLGYGIRTKLAYKSDYLRTGYELKVDSPLFLGNNSSAQLVLADNDDGSQTRIAFKKPYVSLNNTWAGEVYYDDALKTDIVRLGGEDINQFKSDTNDYGAWYSWSKGRQGNTSKRWSVGVTKIEANFSEFTTTTQPSDRYSLVPWIGFSWETDGYRKLKDIYLINQVEDVNFGREFGISLGWDVSNQEQSQGGIHWSAYWRKAYQLSQHSMVVSRAYAQGNELSSGDQRAVVGMDNEIFMRLNRYFATYFRIDGVSSTNQYLDQPITLGGDNGVRGFPLQFQHGQHAISGSFETRYYPNYNIYQLFELGAVVFADIGKAFGGTVYENNSEETLKSVGVGLRAYSSFASNANIVHIDFSRPLIDDPRVNGWEWRVEVKQHF